MCSDSTCKTRSVNTFVEYRPFKLSDAFWYPSKRSEFVSICWHSLQTPNSFQMLECQQVQLRQAERIMYNHSIYIYQLLQQYLSASKHKMHIIQKQSKWKYIINSCKYGYKITVYINIRWLTLIKQLLGDLIKLIYCKYSLIVKMLPSRNL